MSDTIPRTGKIRSVFVKAAKGELVPNNFGSCLLTAVAEGLATKEQVADLLDTDVSFIRRAGNNLKAREIASIARSLTREAGVS